MLKWGQKVTVHVKSKPMNLRKKCEHEIFIGYDERVKEYRVYIKRTKKVQVSQQIQPTDLPIVAQNKSSSGVDDLPTSGDHDENDCEQTDTSLILDDSSEASSDADHIPKTKEHWQSGSRDARLSSPRATWMLQR